MTDRFDQWTVGILCVSAAVVCLVCLGFGWLGRRHRRAMLRPGEIDQIRYKVEAHIHVIDYDRSVMEVMPNGAVVAHCCRAGCDGSVVIGRGVVERMTEEGAQI